MHSADVWKAMRSARGPVERRVAVTSATVWPLLHNGLLSFLDPENSDSDLVIEKNRGLLQPGRHCSAPHRSLNLQRAGEHSSPTNTQFHPFKPVGTAGVLCPREDSYPTLHPTVLTELNPVSVQAPKVCLPFTKMALHIYMVPGASPDSP